jgi:hypothetical protein
MAASRWATSRERCACLGDNVGKRDQAGRPASHAMQLFVSGPVALHDQDLGRAGAATSRALRFAHTCYSASIRPQRALTSGSSAQSGKPSEQRTLLVLEADNSGAGRPSKPNESAISRLARPLRKRRESPEHGAIVGVRTMKQPLRLILIGGTAAACCAVTTLASAQPVPPQSPAGPIADVLRTGR